jgi:hypothetical protein
LGQTLNYPITVNDLDGDPLIVVKGIGCPAFLSIAKVVGYDYKLVIAPGLNDFPSVKTWSCYIVVDDT